MTTEANGTPQHTTTDMGPTAQPTPGNAASPSTATVAGGRRVRLVPPSRRILPQLDREINLLNSDTLMLFRALAAGGAKWPLYLFGPVGTGKTRAALCFADRAESCYYATADSLADLIVRGDADPLFWEMLAAKELAILDELGCRQNVSDLHYCAVKRFLDVRELAGNRMILLSNISPPELQQLYDDRLCSRILQGTWYELDGPDRRCSP